MKYLKITITLMVITLFSTSLLAQQSFVRGAVIDLPAAEVGGVGNIISGVDFDGDGKLEIYAVNDNWNDAAFEVIPRIYKYENNGGTWDSVWSATLAEPLAQNTWPTIAWDDLDADGKNEIYWGPINNFVTGNEDPSRVVVFEAVGDGSDNMGVTDGGGGWLPNATWNFDLAPSTNMRPFKWVIEDIDNDGTKEIILSDRAPYYHIGVFSVDVIPDNGDGSETWTLEYSGPMGTPGIVRAGEIPGPANEPGGWGNVVAGVDFDGDGRKEIYAINDNWNDAPDELIPRIYKWEWSGTYWEQVWMTELTIEAQNTWPALDYGDWDGDGLMELIWGPVNNTSATNPNPSRIVVFEQNADSSDALGVFDGTYYQPNAGWTIVADSLANQRPFRWALTDIDGDMDLELVFGARAGTLRYGVVSVSDIPNNGDGSETWTLEASGLDAGAVVDGGTIYDLAVIDNIAYLFHDNGNITPVAYETAAYVTKPIQVGGMPGGSWKSASVVDIDSNGVKEIVVGQWLSPGYNIFLLQQDADTLARTIIGDFSALGATRLNGGDYGDIDGNGMYDFIFGSRTSFSTENGDIYRLEYLGGDITNAANYTESIVDSKVLETGGQFDIVAFGNIDGDAADEVIYSGIPRSATTVPPLTILDYTDGTIGGGAKYDISIIDNEAYLFASNGNVYPVKYENDRWQVLPVLTGVVPTSGSWKSASVEDIDNDGTKEILIGEWSGSQKIRLLQPMNGGLKSTIVVDLSGEPLPPRLNGGASGDIDGDGFMDFVFGTRDSDGGIYRVEYTGGDIGDPMNYASSRIDESIVTGANQLDIVTIANVDADPELEVIYSGTPRTTYPTPIPIVILDVSLVQTTPLADVRVDADGDFIPDNLGQSFTISAVLTTPNFQANSADYGVYVQDATGGIFVFSNNDDSSAYVIGDLLQITGTVDHFNGLTELVVANSSTDIIKLGTGTVPAPVEIIPSDFYETDSGYVEMYESQLMKIKYVTKKSGTWPDSNGSSTNLTFWDGTEGSEFTFRIDSDMDLRYNPEPTYPVNLFGVVGQFDNSVPQNDGYQLLGTVYANIQQNVAAPPSALFFPIEPADNSTVLIDPSRQSVQFTWNPSVDLNGDPIIYQFRPIGHDPIFANADTQLTVTTATIVGWMGGADSYELSWTVEAGSGSPVVIVPSVDTFKVTFTLLGQEAVMTLDHGTTNLGVTAFNNGYIGLAPSGGNGITWKGAAGLWRGGLVYGTEAGGYVNGQANNNNPANFFDWANVRSNFAAGFMQETMGTVTFDQVTSATIGDSNATTPYGLEVIQKTYSKSDEDVVYYRYGFKNNTGAAITNLYAGLFMDWDVGPGNAYLNNSAGYALSENLVYQFNPGSADPYFGIAAINGLSGYEASGVNAADPAALRTAGFGFISTPDGDPIGANADFRSWTGSVIPTIANGATGWITFAVVAGDDLIGIRENANNAFVVANAAGFTNIVVDVEEEIIPEVFFVDQNYPNPFNPATIIQFGLPTEATVDLRVYDILGQQVAVLYNNELLKAGIHKHNFDGRKLASGTYIYRLQSNDNVVVKKMMLVK